MGYYTAYSLIEEGPPFSIQEFEEDLKEESVFGGEVDLDVTELVNTGSTYAKLYDLDKWISKVAKKHPDVLVILQGDGESSGDIWEKRWKGEDFEQQTYSLPPFTNKNLFTKSEIKNQIK